jgi:hypothetical protein
LLNPIFSIQSQLKSYKRYHKIGELRIKWAQVNCVCMLAKRVDIPPQPKTIWYIKYQTSCSRKLAHPRSSEQPTGADHHPVQWTLSKLTRLWMRHLVNAPIIGPSI